MGTTPKLEDAPPLPPPTRPPERLVDKRNTYLFIPNSEHEDRIGRFYLEQMYGEDLQARIVQAIPVARLTDESTVIVVARKKIKPVYRRQPDAQGMPQEYPVAIEELAQDIQERPPIYVRDYWLEDLELGGKLDMRSFLETLNKAAQPFCVRHRNDEGLLRLFYL